MKRKQMYMAITDMQTHIAPAVSAGVRVKHTPGAERMILTSKERQSNGNECNKDNVDGSVHQAGHKAIGNPVLDKLVFNHVIYRHSIHL